ncbi:hypothetical protein D3C71_1655940 [compost metagenome]
MAETIGQVLRPQHLRGRDDDQPELQAGQIYNIGDDAAGDHDEHPVALAQPQLGKAACKAACQLQQLSVRDFLVFAFIA